MGRDELLDAAFRSLAATGSVRPDDVAREAGASKALVFHHFGSTRGLEEAMAERILRQTREGLDALARERPNPRLRLEALVRALLAEPPDPPAPTRRVMRFWLAEDERGRARDALVVDFVAKTLREARSHADARSIAALLLARWHGATAIHASVGGLDFEREADRLAKEIDALV